MSDGTIVAARTRTSTPRRIRPGRTGGTRPVQNSRTAWAACVVVLATATLSASACAQPAVSTTNFGGLVTGDTSAGDTVLLAGAGAESGLGARLGAGLGAGRVPGAADTMTRSFRSEADSLEWDSARHGAERSRGFRLIIDLFERRLWAIRGDDTLHVAAVGVGMDSTLAWQDTVWQFHTPRGRHVVRNKERRPIWVPPDWHYVETAHRLGLELEQLRRGRSRPLTNGRRLLVRGERIQLVDSTGTATPFPADEEIIFDGVLFIPPFDTRNRRIEDELGPYKLDLGGGYLIHGTPHYGSVGRASTHGCVRLDDADIEWLYRNVPVGTRVYVY